MSRVRATATQASANSGDWALDRIAWNLPQRPRTAHPPSLPEPLDEPDGPSAPRNNGKNRGELDSTERTGVRSEMSVTRRLRARIRKWLGLGKIPARAPYTTGAP